MEKTERETLQRAQLYIVIIFKAFVYMYSRDVNDCVYCLICCLRTAYEAVRHIHTLYLIAVVVLTLLEKGEKGYGPILGDGPTTPKRTRKRGIAGAVRVYKAHATLAQKGTDRIVSYSFLTEYSIPRLLACRIHNSQRFLIIV